MQILYILQWMLEVNYLTGGIIASREYHLELVCSKCLKKIIYIISSMLMTCFSCPVKNICALVY